MSLKLSAPQPLAATHLLNDFECGERVLDDWLKRRAMNNQLSGASRTFVVVDEENRVRGVYAMAAGAVSHQLATSAIRRNMPDPVPVMVLGRLAVDCRAQGIKMGAAMLQDAVNRAITVSQNTGGSRTARSCASQTGQAVLRALRLSGIAAASNDIDAAPEHR